MITRNATTQPAPTILRIGEVAKLTGLTTRTLRYWEEQGLIESERVPGSGGAALLAHGHGSCDPHQGPAGAAGILTG